MTTPADRNRDSGTRELDVVVYGATGFVGRLVAGHLAQHAPDGTRIGLAGRSAERLEKIRDGLGPSAAGWPILHADSEEPDSLAALAAGTRVVVTTVGPYARWGMPLVQACAQAGTDYVDLTGEVLFVRSSIDSWHDTAAETGARIVHSCGFDSIPSDLGVLMLHERVRSDGEGELADTTLVVTSLRGGISGGTIDSLRLQLDTVKRDKGLRKIAASPYSLSPDRNAEPDLGGQSDVRIVEGSKIDPTLRGWKAPFVMGSFNTRVVRRSNAVLDWAYGRTFRYSEVMSVGSSPLSVVVAGAVAAGLGGLVAGLSFGPTRALLDRVLPSPGEGPSAKTRENGHFTIDVFTETTTGARYRSRVAAQGDPGYAATAVMLGESALTLVHDRDSLPDKTGVLTPATAMGDALLDRLQLAGFTMEVERLG
ncbi:enoyl-ACP reductase [Rhodococcus sp. D2-41]|uniref:saccharopine dehydrogenase family protein n=1 Tax=Speluncibacter jeojiensis TaxID=2710754 RepID=UPI00240F3E0A|nr:saccharopine dehydrogenase NADP-binding domain-containing protein [Rhodococcus sp. D2-41]MDG3008546.1 enoyl-ACP reductase [Rhodococcus sp. D2-41]